MPTTHDRPRHKTAYDAIKSDERYKKAFTDIVNVIESAGITSTDAISLLEYIIPDDFKQ